MKYVRTSPKSYKLINQTFYNLKPGKFYKFGVWIKTKNVKAFKGGGAGLCLEFSTAKDKNGKRKYLSGNFLTGISGTQNWTLVSATKRVPPNAAKANLTLYLWKGATGTAWYDDVFIEELGANLWTAYTLSPYNTPIDGKCTVIMFYDNKPVMNKAPRNKLYGQLYFKELNKTFAVKIENNKAHFNLKGLPEGTYQTKYYCLDTARKVVLYSKTIPITISKTPLKRKVAIDSKGNTLVNGKKFLPVGVFLAGLNKKDIDTLTAGGVNCVLPYSSLSLRFYRKKNSIQSIKEVLDYCSKKDLKVIFSAKDIGSKNRWGVNKWYGAVGQKEIVRKLTQEFKDHPALFAWYLNDEQPLSEIQRLTQMRQQFNKLDPEHPTYGLDYKAESYPMFGPTADIFGGSDYSIRKKTGNTQVRNEYEMKQFEKMQLPIWVAPQMMNMGAFYGKDKNDCAKKARNPSEAEMRSMVMLHIIYGAKGFIFYHYNYLKSWKLPKDNFEKAWPDFCKVVKTLHDLKPFILSDKPVEKVKLKQIAGQIRGGKLTSDNGANRILLVTIGPGKAKAVISLPGKNNLKSKFGLTKNLGNCKYEFTASGIDSDILY